MATKKTAVLDAPEMQGPESISAELAEAIKKAGDLDFVAPEHEVILVTPPIAALWLSQNPRNRSLRRHKIEEYATAMREGKWNFDGQPIRRGVTEEGKEIVLDGQHRLNAILESETSQLMSVWRFIKIDAQDTMDIGLKRSAGDSLKMRGEKYTAALAGVLAMTLRWTRGVRAGNLTVNTGIGTVQIQDQLQFLDAHPDIRDGVIIGQRVRTAVGGRVPISVLGTAHFLFSNLGDDMCEEQTTQFFGTLESGEGLLEGSPILALRNQWIRSARDKINTHQSYYLAQIIKAWNMYRDGESAQRVILKHGASNPETFPEPH
jgi:hypothetical protein